MPLALQKVLQRQRLQWGFIHQCFFRRSLLFGFQDESGREGVFVHAFVAAIGAGPEPSVLAFFNRGDEVFADFVGSSFRIAMFVEDDLAEFLCASVLLAA